MEVKNININNFKTNWDISLMGCPNVTTTSNIFNWLVFNQQTRTETDNCRGIVRNKRT